MAEYIVDIYTTPYTFRIIANVLITFMLAISVMLEAKGDLPYVN